MKSTRNKIIDDSKLVAEQTKHLTKHHYIEWMKCRSSFAYWCMNYAVIEDATGNTIKIGDSPRWNEPNSKYLASAKLIDAGIPLLVIGSRQMGKSILQQLLLAHRATFYPSSKLVFITIDSVRAEDAILRINAILSHQPKWMQVPSTNRQQNATFISLQNGSKLLTFTVSGNKKATDVARGLSTYTISIDESAFIRDFEAMYMSLAPAYSTASKAAKLHGLVPSMILTTTPNGTMNPFFSFWDNGIELNEIYDFENNKLRDNWREVIDASENGFVKVPYYWWDIYDEVWYAEQKKILNNNKLAIAQELDCKFIGNSESIFEPETLEKLVVQPPIKIVQLSHGTSISFIEKPRYENNYIIGVDTAGTSTENSDFSAITIIEAETERTIAELKWKNGIIRRFAEVIRDLVEFLYSKSNVSFDNIHLAIENNSYGKNVIEQLLYEESEYDYHPYDTMIIKTSTAKPVETINESILPRKKKQKDVRDAIVWQDGINTNVKTRPQMINAIISAVNTRPHTIQTRYLISELSSLIMTKNGKIEASKGAKDDVVMSYGLALYGKKQLLVQGKLYLEETKDTRYKAGQAEQALEDAINNVMIDNKKYDDNEPKERIPISSDYDEFDDLIYNPF